jgi:hypothetical protein
VRAHEQDSRIWDKREDSSSGFDSVDRREPDVQDDEIRPEPLGFLNRLKSIGGFTDNLALQVVPKRRRDIATPGLVILNDQNADRHSGNRGVVVRHRIKAGHWRG